MPAFLNPVTLAALLLCQVPTPSPPKPQAAPAPAVRQPAGAPADPAIAKAARLFDQALQAQRSRRLRRAAELYREVVKSAPKAFPAWVNLGLVLLDRGELAASESAFRRAATLDARSAVPPAQIAAICLRLKRAPEAAEWARKAIAIIPKDVSVRMTLAVALSAQRDYAGAERELGEAIRISPRDVHPRLDLVLLLVSQKKQPEAIAAMRAVTAAFPTSTEAWALQAQILQAARQFDAAHAAFVRVAELNPRDALAWFNLGLSRQLFTDRGANPKMRDAAITAYARSIELNPRVSAAHSNIARLYYLMENYAAAVKHYRAALALEPTSARLLSDTAVAETWAAQAARDLKERKQLQAAAEGRLRKALGGKPARAQFVAMGFLMEQQARVDEAIDVYRRWGQALPKDPAAPVSEGRLRLQQTRYADAETLMRRALTIDPKDPEAILGVAKALAGQRKTAAAVEQYRKAASAAPTNPEPLRLLARLFEDENRRPEAITTYNAVKRLDPLNYAPYASIAGLEERAGHPDVALREFQAYATLKSADVPSRANAARLLEKLRRWDEARAMYVELVKLVPGDGYYSSGEARVYEAQGKPDLAVAAYHKLCDASPGSVSFRGGLAGLLGRLGRWEDAVTEYRAALKIDAKADWAWIRIGEAYEGLKRTDDARAAYLQVADGQPTHAVAYDKLQAIYEREGRGEAWYGLVEAHATRGQGAAFLLPRLEAAAVSLKRTDTMFQALKAFVDRQAVERSFLLAYAQMLVRGNRQAEALDVERRAARLDPSDLQIRLTIASQLEAGGRIPELIAEYEEIVAIKSLTPAVCAAYRIKLAGLYEKNGQRAEALREYRAAAKADPTNKVAADAARRLGN